MTERALIETYRKKLEECENFAERKEMIETIVEFCTNATFIEKSDVKTPEGIRNLLWEFSKGLNPFFRTNMEAIPSPDCLPHPPTEWDQLTYEEALEDERSLYLTAFRLFLETLDTVDPPPNQPTAPQPKG